VGILNLAFSIGGPLFAASPDPSPLSRAGIVIHAFRFSSHAGVIMFLLFRQDFRNFSPVASANLKTSFLSFPEPHLPFFRLLVLSSSSLVAAGSSPNNHGLSLG